jgi:putative DNA primase/helicase
MSRGWFNDSIRSFEGKEASELLQGVWIVEVGELDAFRRTDVARIKQFLSLRADRFRAAYGRHVKELPRCCVFFGTTNTAEFLQDRTGNRRFWPIDVGVSSPTKKVWGDLDNEVDQLWAEAVMRWRMGETLYITGELEDTAKERQESHRERSAREGVVLDFIERQVPEEWNSWALDKRKMFWGGSFVETNSLTLAPRDRVCALEVWCEALDGRQKDMTYTDAVEINGILENAPGWVRSKKSIRCGYCGVQRGFVRKTL